MNDKITMGNLRKVYNDIRKRDSTEEQLQANNSISQNGQLLGYLPTREVAVLLLALWEQETKGEAL
jgi:hypothetical protein